MEKFKVCDWVVSEKGISTITDIKYNGKNCESKIFFENGICMFECDVELWQPKEGEWCWYNKKYFIKVKNIKDEQIYFSSLDGMYINDWDYLCKFEPFIGKLPTFLKDSK